MSTNDGRHDANDKEGRTIEEIEKMFELKTDFRDQF